jgi:hypothetical protein
MSNANLNFNWYAIVQDLVIEQGDILLSFPVLEPRYLPDQDQSEGIPYKYYNLIVMTQSCDFQKMREQDFVVFCPLYNYGDIPEKSKNNWDSLRKGNVLGKYLLNKFDSDNLGFDYQLADLRRIITIPYRVIEEKLDQQPERVRLLPPYREHLSQAFAKLFMRVGLPEDLPIDYPY